MTLHSEASDGAILNYLAGTTDAASSGALRRIAALVAAMQGAGSPEGVLTAAVGSLYTDTTNGVLYIKATGTGNTGWSALSNGDMSLKANLAGPTFTGTVVLPSTTSIGTVSSTELGYVDGVTSAIQTQLNAKPGHNLLHNGAMQVHQRGASVTGITSSGYYTADRWYGAINTIGTWTQSVENDAPTGSGFRKSLKMRITANSDATIDAADYVRILQYVEGQNLQSVLKGTASAQQLTVSFWVKSNKTGTYVVELYDVDNTRHVAATYTVVSSATWEQHTVTFPADLTGAFDNDKESSLALLFHLADGSDSTSGTLATTWAASTAANRGVGQTNLAAADDNYWQITGCQLEVGSAATAFEHKDIAQELAECQRYYWQTGQGYQCMGQVYTTTNVVGFFNYPVQMRTGPTALAKVGAATDYYVYKADASTATCSAVPTFLTGTVNVMGVTFTVASGLVAGNVTICGSIGAAGVFGFSADL